MPTALLYEKTKKISSQYLIYPKFQSFRLELITLEVI